MFIDLELNKDGANTTDIIQVGWCIGDINGNFISKGYSFAVASKPIDSFITSLTGITDNDMINAPSLDEAVGILVTEHEKYKCDRILCQWGQGDLQCIREQIKDKTILKKIGKRSTDVKTLFWAFARANNISTRAGLSKSMESLGLKFEGLQHRADIDAFNTFKIFSHLIKKYKQVGI